MRVGLVDKGLILCGEEDEFWIVKEGELCNDLFYQVRKYTSVSLFIYIHIYLIRVENAK